MKLARVLSATSLLGLQMLSANVIAGDHEGGMDALTKALTEGKAKVDVRYRYENVDDESATDEAKANTVRTRIGYGTGSFYGFSLYGEMEDIRDVFDEEFNSTTNGETSYATVPDPQETELNQLYIQYAAKAGAMDVLLRHGRQRQKWDNDRFIGNVGWRQNEQTYDASLIKLSSSELGLSLMYTHQTNVNRIFGEGAGQAGNFDVKSDNFNLTYTGIDNIKATGYYYLWEGQDTAGLFTVDDSRKTAGVRLLGSFPVSEGIKIMGTAEYASQSDYKDATDFSSLDYTLFELGASFKLAAAPITIKAGMETLEGDIEDGESFITPYATLHAFQGWADVFLGSGITGSYGGEAAGIEDTYFSIGTKLAGTKLLAVYHEYEPDDSDSSYSKYGSELDLLAVKTFAKHYTLGLKYADFNSKDGYRSGADTEKLWAWLQVKF